MSIKMKTSKAGREFIKGYESLELKAYPDPKTGGDPWTIGYGHTGPEVHKGLVWTKTQCEIQFEIDLSIREEGVNFLVTREIPQGLFDALVSFAYNCGLDIDSDVKAEGLGDSTLLKYVNAGEFDKVPAEFMKWISRGTSVEKGLRNRRAGEIKMFT